MVAERLPDSQVEDVLRLLLRGGHTEAAMLLGEVHAVEVVPGTGSAVSLELTFDDFVAEDLSRRQRQQIDAALTEFLATTGRTVTAIKVKTVAVELPSLVADDTRPWRARFVDGFRTNVADQRFLYLVCAAVAFAVPVQVVLGTEPSWAWAAWLLGGWTCGVLLLMFWRWLDPKRPFTRGHATRVVEAGEAESSTTALCSCGWIGGFGDSIDVAVAEARRHSTAEPEVLSSADAVRMLSREAPNDAPPAEPA